MIPTQIYVKYYFPLTFAYLFLLIFLLCINDIIIPELIDLFVNLLMTMFYTGLSNQHGYIYSKTFEHFSCNNTNSLLVQSIRSLRNH